MVDQISAGAGFPGPVEVVPTWRGSGPVLYIARFDAASLSTVRRRIRHHLGLTRLSPERADDFLIAVAEVLANAIEHGGGRGALGLREADAQLSCDISDAGPGMPRGAGAVRTAAPLDESGRGLRLVHMICDKVIHHPVSTGTRITLMMAVLAS